MRRWDSSLFPHLAKVFSHIEWLDAHLVAAELELRTLRQSSMQFGDDAPKYAPPKPRDYTEVLPLKERLKQMVKYSEVGSPKWLRTLRYNKLTEESAMKLIFEL